MTSSFVDLVPLLARRESLLSRLYDGTRSKSDLVDSLDVSRSTVDRCVRKLEAAGLVERREGSYGLSLAGRLVFEEYVQFRERGTSIGEAVEVLSAVPPDADLNGDALANADIIMADRKAPYRPAEVHLNQVRGADRVFLVSTTVSPRYLATYHDAVVNSGLNLRLVATDSVTSILVSKYPDELTACFETGRLKMHQYDGEPPFSLSIVERPESVHLGLLVYDDGGVRGYITSESDMAITFGYDQFKRYRERSTPIPNPSSLQE